MTSNATRNNIVLAADQLFYERGFEHTSFAEIAKLIGISRGNFYHHFKSKDQILDAVIERRLIDRQVMLDRWEIDGETPNERIKSFVGILLLNQKKIRAFGCPVGTLFLELSKLNHSSEDGARRILDLFRTWLTRQFSLAGCGDDADNFAMQLLSRSQGVATLANAYPGEDFLEREVQQMNAWVNDIMEIDKEPKQKNKRS